MNEKIAKIRSDIKGTLKIVGMLFNDKSIETQRGIVVVLESALQSIEEINFDLWLKHANPLFLMELTDTGGGFEFYDGLYEGIQEVRAIVEGHARRDVLESYGVTSTIIK